ncbi:MAG: sigma-54 dependent transcriptional regulator [Planctomycetaceae bacterium]|nr:sigma-54 dependent transcriptional regulator [Planctomycetaceae bacterium]
MDILLVDDDAEFADTAIQWLIRRGHRALTAATGRQGIALAEQQRFDVAIVDLMLPDLSGLDVLRELKAAAEETEVVLLTGSGTIETAVEAMRRGAYDYLTKPFPLARLEERCRLACERGQLVRENRQLRHLLQRERRPAEIVGNAPCMLELQRLIDRIAPTEKPVLILGESGTGKELVARAIQERSRRAAAPFVVINCAALPESLVESELFGHEKGAFTGAVARKDGLFEVADGGTLFVDEIGELPLTLQPKLLRVLENGSMRRVGSHRERVVDVRLIAATNRDLQNEVSAGRFREDLYYRINVLTLTLPPLRERMQDLPRLIEHFLPQGWILDPPALEALTRYGWPGNVRQLINALERASILAEDRLITVDDLPHEIGIAASPGAPLNLPTETQVGSLAELERTHVLRVLQEAHGNKSQAARLLGVHRRTLYRLLERLGIATDDTP